MRRNDKRNEMGQDREFGPLVRSSAMNVTELKNSGSVVADGGLCIVTRKGCEYQASRTCQYQATRTLAIRPKEVIPHSQGSVKLAAVVWWGSTKARGLTLLHKIVGMNKVRHVWTRRGCGTKQR